MLDAGTNEVLFSIIKPYISGMSLGEINDIVKKLNTLSFVEFEEWVDNRPHNRKLRVVLDICYDELKEAMP